MDNTNDAKVHNNPGSTKFALKIFWIVDHQRINTEYDIYEDFDGAVGFGKFLMETVQGFEGASIQETFKDGSLGRVWDMAVLIRQG